MTHTEQRVADLETSVSEMCDILEWLLVRFATKTDAKDIKERLLPRLDLARTLVGPDDAEHDTPEMDLLLPGREAPLDGGGGHG